MADHEPAAAGADGGPTAPLTVFVTERLAVRHWHDGDLADLVGVYGDADAMRWVGEGRALTTAECLRWIEVTRENIRRRGYGMFAMTLRHAPVVVGFCGLVHPGGQPLAEVKYALHRAHWGRGYATEAVAGLLSHGARAHGLGHVVATAAPANLASHRVLLKAGLRPTHLRDNADGTRTQCFEWRATPTPTPAG